MPKTLLITGATDGIGLATARLLAPQGHQLLLHGRNPAKLEQIQEQLSGLPGAVPVDGYLADLSRLSEVAALAQAVAAKHSRLDVLINNAGVLKVAETRTPDGLDVRFAVNTIAPYLLTRRLLPLLGSVRLGSAGRVVNLSSAAQAPVDLQALTGKVAGKGQPSDMEAYSQSKLAITMWTRQMAQTLGDDGPMIVAVNPASLLATKMVRQGFGMAGNDVGVGADILTRAALSDEFADASGLYFDNDSRRFAAPHADALDPQRCADLVCAIDAVLAELALGQEG